MNSSYIKISLINSKNIDLCIDYFNKLILNSSAPYTTTNTPSNPINNSNHKTLKEVLLLSCYFSNLMSELNNTKYLKYMKSLINNIIHYNSTNKCIISFTSILLKSITISNIENNQYFMEEILDYIIMNDTINADANIINKRIELYLDELKRF